jgi:hypothetical protein
MPVGCTAGFFFAGGAAAFGAFGLDAFAGAPRGAAPLAGFAALCFEAGGAGAAAFFAVNDFSDFLGLAFDLALGAGFVALFVLGLAIDFLVALAGLEGLRVIEGVLPVGVVGCWGIETPRG